MIGYPNEHGESNAAMAELGCKTLKEIECNLKLFMVWLLRRNIEFVKNLHACKTLCKSNDYICR